MDDLTAFGLSASDAGHFADVMAYAMANSNTSTEMLGEAYKNSASTAKQFGLSMEETTAWISAMANSGVKGAEAGTTLNAVLARLYGETEMTNEAMEKYGLTMYDTEGKAKNFTQVMVEIEEAMKGMSEEEQNVFLKAVAGTNQLSGFATMIGAGADDVDTFTEALRGCDGAAEEMASVMQDNLQGSIKLLLSNLEETAIQLYEMKDGILKNFVDGLNDMVTGFQSLSDETKNTIITIAAVVAALGPLILISGEVVKSIGAIGSAFGVIIANPILAGVVALAGAVAYLGVKAIEAEASQAKYNQTLLEAIQMSNDLTSATESETQALQDKADTLEEQIEYVENYSSVIEENNARMQEIEETMNSLDATRQEDINSIQELQSEYESLAEENRNLIGTMGDNNSAITEHIEALESEYGSIENAKEVCDAYKQRLENVQKAKETLNECTNETSKATAEEALQLQTTSAQAQALMTKYISLSNAQANNKTESNELKGVREALIKIVGNECQYIDASTGKWAINTQAVNDQIVSNSNLAEGKRQACESMNKNDVELLRTCIANSQARIKAWENELKAYAQVQMAEAQATMSAYTVTEKVMSNKLGLESAETKAAKARAEATKNAIEVEKGKLEEYTSAIKEFEGAVDSGAGSLGNFSSAAGGAGDSASKAGSSAKSSAEDALAAYQKMYTQKKKLGQTDLNEQEKMLEEMKAKYSDTAEHQISVNEFAQSEILEIIKQRITDEGLSVDDSIAMYENAKEKYCSNEQDKADFEEQISASIKETVSDLTDDLKDMDLDKIENTRSTLETMKEKYANYGDAVEAIEEALTDTIETEYDKREDELENTLSKMRSVLDEFYGKQEDDLTAESETRQAEIQKQIDDLEAAQEAKELIEKEAKLKKAIAEAEDLDAKKEAESNYNDWLVTQRKKALQQQLKDEKEALKEKKQALEDEKASTEELLSYQETLEKEKLKVKKEHQELSDDEVAKIAIENLEKRQEEEQKSTEEAFQNLFNNADMYRDLGEEQMKNYLEGLESYAGQIRSYYESLMPDTDISVSSNGTVVNGSHANGLSYVPYDGYIAELHEGERVLTKAEAQNYTINQNTTQNYNQSMDTSTLEAKLDKVIETVARIPKQFMINSNMA